MESIIKGMEPSSRPLVVACSPQSGGNSDFAARRVAQALAAAGGEPRVVYVRDFVIHPCVGCQICVESAGGRCAFMRDQAEELFRLILGAPVLFFVSPIYFYHVPALFKGFIDRSQRYFRAREAGDQGLIGLPRRRAHAVLMGGRERGEKLFDGTLLSLRYFLQAFNVDMGESVCLYGVDRPGDLEADQAACGRVEALAVRAWRGLS